MYPLWPQTRLLHPETQPITFHVGKTTYVYKCDSLGVSCCQDWADSCSCPVCRISLTSCWAWRQSSLRLARSRPSSPFLRTTAERLLMNWRSESQSLSCAHWQLCLCCWWHVTVFTVTIDSLSVTGCHDESVNVSQRRRLKDHSQFTRFFLAHVGGLIL